MGGESPKAFHLNDYSVRGDPGFLFSQVRLKKATPAPGISFDKWVGFSLCHVRELVSVMCGLSVCYGHFLVCVLWST